LDEWRVLCASLVVFGSRLASPRNIVRLLILALFLKALNHTFIPCCLPLLLNICLVLMRSHDPIHIHDRNTYFWEKVQEFSLRNGEYYICWAGVGEKCCWLIFPVYFVLWLNQVQLFGSLLLKYSFDSFVLRIGGKVVAFHCSVVCCYCHVFACYSSLHSAICSLSLFSSWDRIGWRKAGCWCYFNTHKTLLIRYFSVCEALWCIICTCFRSEQKKHVQLQYLIPNPFPFLWIQQFLH